MIWLRRFLLALGFSLLFGFAVGTVIRLRLERPIEYIGALPSTVPFDVGDPRARVLDASHHEQQVG